MTRSNGPSSKASARVLGSPTSMISTSGNSRTRARRMSIRSSGLSSTMRMRNRSFTQSASRDLGVLVQHQPVQVDVLHHLEQRLEPDRLGQVRVDAQVVGTVDVHRLPRGGEHHHRQTLDHRLLAHPGQHLETRAPGQLQVQQHEDGQRKARPVVVGSLPAQVRHRLLAVADELDRVGQVGLAEGALDEQGIVRRILDEQDGEGARVHAGAPSASASSTQNRLPAPGSDSTPACPPRRVAPFCTMARPMPVPGYCCMPCSRSKARKIRSWCSGAMPMPLSSTQSRTRPCSRSPRTRTRGGASGLVNLTALARRLVTIWPSTARWASTRPSGRSTTISPPRSLTSSSSAPRASSTTVSRLTGSKVTSARTSRL